ncbi:hypothetical protein [Ochrobactrum soli]|uniref:hypothetical protein n=1 Tax=Ochrobactrum soli TaxID=2448455 RepID=UPI001F36DEF8|nr:hypothetical protein [[Ochrobactrum] soli]
MPWLRPFFEKARPDWLFLDPADSVVSTLPATQGGSGRTVALVTESAAYPVSDFRKMLETLGISLDLTVVEPAIG